MGYSKEQILSDIHTGSPAPEKNKDTKKSKDIKLSKKQVEFQEADNKMSEDEYNAAKAFYDIACPILNIKQDKFPFNARNPIEQLSTDDSKALGDLSEAVNKDLPTDEDFKNRNKAIIALQKNPVFACEIYDFLTELNNEGLGSMLRSLNHISRYNNKKINEYEYNIISKGNNQKSFEALKKCFKDGCINFINKPLADDVFTGAKKELVNGFIDLMNKTLSFSHNSCMVLDDGKGNPFDTKDITIKIPKFKIPAEIANKEIEDATKKATTSGGFGKKVSDFVKNMAQTALNNMRMNSMRNESILNVAIRMQEALDPLQVYEAGLLNNTDITIDFTNIASIENAKKILRPQVGNLELLKQTDHQKQLDLRDYNLINNVQNFLKKPEDVKTLLDKGSINNIMAKDLFETLSRRMYIQSNFKTSLTDWDEKAGDLLFDQVPSFQDFISIDNANRPNDEQDKEDFEQNISSIQNELEEKNNMAGTMPDFNDVADKEAWISNHPDLIPFLSPQQLMYTKYAQPMGIKNKPKPEDKGQQQEDVANQVKADTQDLKNKKKKASARNVGNVNISSTKQNQQIVQNALTQKNESISDVANELLEFLR